MTLLTDLQEASPYSELLSISQWLYFQCQPSGWRVGDILWLGSLKMDIDTMAIWASLTKYNSEADNADIYQRWTTLRSGWSETSPRWTHELLTNREGWCRVYLKRSLLTQVCYFPFKTTKQIVMLDLFLFKHSSTRGYGFCQDNKQKEHRHKWQRHLSDSGRKRGTWWRKQGKGDMASVSLYISSQKGKIGGLSDHGLQGTRKHWKTKLIISLVDAKGNY